jgi:hypothetical protein
VECLTEQGRRFDRRWIDGDAHDVEIVDYH